MEIQKHISTASWMDLSWQVRTQLVKDLNIPKSKDVVLQDNVVLTDGRTQNDINQAITIESLQEYTKSSLDDIFELFGKAVEKAEYELYLKEHPEARDEDNKPNIETNDTNTKPRTKSSTSTREKGTNKGRTKANKN
jgi:predicted HTH domain antitoxin